MNLVEASKSLSGKITSLSEATQNENVTRAIQPIDEKLEKYASQMIRLKEVASFFVLEPSIEFKQTGYYFNPVRQKMGIVLNNFLVLI